MRLFCRKYLPGDEEQINELYKLITGRERAYHYYEWEWLKTWDGAGDIWLLFDKNGESEKLLCQYSLIPMPISVFGDVYKVGKTENCMSHPDCRGKGIYLPHEKKNFEISKKRFDIFFTTAGDVANGSVSRIRKRLGYKPFDSWILHFFMINENYILKKMLKKKIGQSKNLFLFYFLFSKTICYILYLYFKVTTVKNKKKFKNQKNYKFHVDDASEANLKEIEFLWEKNKKNYGITAHRSFQYLKWRIIDNPYIKYYCLLLKENNELKGYAYFWRTNNNDLFIEDILMANKNIDYLNQILFYLVSYAKKNKYDAVVCSILLKNKILHNGLKKNGFLNNKLKVYLNEKFNKNERKPFLIYFPDNLKRDSRLINPENWYVTSLFNEGRADI